MLTQLASGEPVFVQLGSAFELSVVLKLHLQALASRTPAGASSDFPALPLTGLVGLEPCISSSLNAYYEVSRALVSLMPD